MPANNSSLPFTLSVGFPPKGFSDSDFSMSPTSTPEAKHFSCKHHQKLAPTGLALVGALTNDTSTHNRLYLFGSQLKSQLPPSPPQSPIESEVKRVSFSPEFLAGMELSEEYTCVISHRPNTKTTHIFDNCVVERWGGKLGYVAWRKESEVLRYSSAAAAAAAFLSCCHTCKQKLSQGRDIFMYRGEKAFCSEECRRREMMLDNGEDEFTQDLSDLLC